MTGPTEGCTKCGQPKPLTAFPIRQHPATCRADGKACRALAMKTFRQQPIHAERLREQEQQRSRQRLPYIRAWQATHPDALRAAWKRAEQRQAQPHPPVPGEEPGPRPSWQSIGKSR